MSEHARMQSFLHAARSVAGGSGAIDDHALLVAAKKVRLVVGTGRELESSDWAELFPDHRIRECARAMLTEVAILELDFDATLLHSAPRPDPAVLTLAAAPEAIHSAPRVDSSTLTTAATAEAVERRWHSLLTGVPDDGLPADNGAGTITSLELGRMILRVSQGKGRASFGHLPSAGGFRDRFVACARDADRLDMIDDLPADGI